MNTTHLPLPHSASQPLERAPREYHQGRRIRNDNYIELIKKYEAQFDNDPWSKLSSKQVRLAHLCRYILHSLWWVIVLDTFLLILLFGKQISLACCGPSVDVFVNILLFLSAAVFTIEIVLLLFSRLRYFLSALFFVDIICFLLIALEISFVREALFQQDTTVTKKYAVAIYSIVDVLKLVLIVKLIRIFYWKVYANRSHYLEKHLSVPPHDLKFMLKKRTTFPEKENFSLSIANIHSAPSLYTKSMRESQTLDEREKVAPIEDNYPRDDGEGSQSSPPSPEVYKNHEPLLAVELMNFTNNNLMFLLLFMLLLMPIFDREFWMETPPSYQYDTTFAGALMRLGSVEDANLYAQSLEAFYPVNNMVLLSFVIPGVINYSSTTVLNSLRVEEIRRWSENITLSDGSVVQGSVGISIRYMIVVQSLLYLAQTLLIILFFVASMLLFDKDAHKRVVIPIQKMVSRIKKMAADPHSVFGREATAPQNSDLVLIEETIEKVSFMLLLGFGEAGTKMFSKLLSPGKLYDSLFYETEAEYCIFGFCDIRNFTDITDVLKQDVLDFVNQIAEIVHKEISLHEGFANKNIGDAFLLVWKLQKPRNLADNPQTFTNTLRNYDNDNGSYRAFPSVILTTLGETEDRNVRVAEMALLSFIKITSRIKCDDNITFYNRHEGLKAAIPNFEVKLGCGLHAGWGLEGPIGSFMKIDLSYFSESVDMAAQLEGLTKFYHCSILFTKSIYDLINHPLLKILCRRIDRIRLPSSKIYDIYTVDTHGDTFPAPQFSSTRQEKTASKVGEGKSPFFFSSKKEITGNKADNAVQLRPEEYMPYSRIDTFREYVQADPILQHIVAGQSGDEAHSSRLKFLDLHNEAIDLYLKGKWHESNSTIEKLYRQCGNDEIIESIKEYMSGHGFKPPAGWDGARII